MNRNENGKDKLDKRWMKRINLKIEFATQIRLATDYTLEKLIRKY
jgi:hypothetical protein